MNFMRLSQLVSTAFAIYIWLIFARLVVSWLRLDFYHPIVQFLFRITEPALRPIRRLIPPAGGLDFSPVIVFSVLELVHVFVVGMLRRAGL